MYVGMEAMQGEQSQSRMLSTVAQAGQQVPNVFEPLDIVQAARLDSGLGLADQSDPGVGRLGTFSGRECEHIHLVCGPGLRVGHLRGSGHAGP